MGALLHNLPGLTSVVAAIVLNALWQDIALVALVWPLLRYWPGLNAATRYTIWSLVLVAAVILPIATTLAFVSAPPAAPLPTSARMGVRVRSVAAKLASHAQVSSRAIALKVASHAEAISTPTRALAAAPSYRPIRARITLPLPLAAIVFCAWFLLVAVSLVRLAVGIGQLERLKRDALPLPVEFRDAMSRWEQANKGSREVRLCVSDATYVPVAVGLFDAMILIPRVLLDVLSAAEIDQISLHELAHLRRADDWGNGIQRILSALLPWNPAALIIGRQLDLEREVACDDWVLSLTGAVRPYALTLTKMAETSSWPLNPIAAPGVFASRKHISIRVERLLRAGRNIATKLAFVPMAVGLVLVGAIALGITMITPSIAAPTTPRPAATPAVPRAVPRAVPTGAPSHSPSALTTRPTMLPSLVSVAPRRSSPAPKRRLIARITPPRVVVARSPAHKVQGGRTILGVDDSGVDWSGRNLSGVRYTAIDLSDAILVGTNFANAQLTGVDFSKSDLRQASFRNATLTGCNFDLADLRGVDFSGAGITGCSFTNARLPKKHMRGVLASCSGCDFSDTDLRGLDLSNLHASGDDLAGADLRRVNFAGAKLVGIDFRGARLAGANFTNTTLEGCDLRGVDLTHVDVSRANLIGVDLSKGHSN
ncbi:MAG TPA: pentapeptide repeat-containing protein [Candidatus Dormibacteraeota bacterium]|nr:pentapeptide repeat-containing protein [Candidatus Dormibacteraeota bacterium]